MEYLHLFKTKTEHDSFYGGNKYKEPWLAYIRDNTLVTGNKSYEYYRNEYFTLSVMENGEITITIPSKVNSTYASYLSYSKDKSDWTETVVDSTDQTITILVSTGDKVYLQGNALRWAITPGPPSSASINSTANIIASGNIMSLLYGEEFKDKTAFPNEAGFVFYELFKNNTHLINAENLILPATTLTQYCYYGMFQGCSSLTTAPTLPATKLASNCYSSMFYGCSKLNNITMLATNISASYCLYNWVSDVAPTGTFTKAASMTSLTRGASGIPSGWTVVDK